jgi:N-acetyl-gamma-glutamyl-phosphate reductase
MPDRIPTIVIGASGYVGGETIRLLAGHPVFQLEAATSRSAAGNRIATAFPHLAGFVGEDSFEDPGKLENLLDRHPNAAVFCALPHGESAPVLRPIASRYPEVRIVDMSADFRFTDGDDGFFCGIPELEVGNHGRLIAHPGCFATCITLALAPLAKKRLCEGLYFVSGVTGSTGSGATPKATTHHPVRNGAMFAYQPLRHRHTPEVEMMLDRLGGPAKLSFVPHSGPFSRGIHVTAQGVLSREAPLMEVYREIYADCPFIGVLEAPPSVRDVAGTNRCHIGVSSNGKEFAVTAVIDNLVKGAAGGAMQWMNRLFGLPEITGLNQPGLGWA